MKIAILLPYKENFSPIYPGAVSIFLNSVIKLSKYKNKITVYGNTKFQKKYNIKYINIEIPKKILGLGSQTTNYIRKFSEIEKKSPSDIIEVHNRPLYIQLLLDGKAKKVLYFHNDPLSMNGSKNTDQRIFLINKCSKIIFNSEWSKKRFLTQLDNIYKKSEKLMVVHQSTQKQIINLKKKENNYFCWKIKQSKRVRYFWFCNY